MSSWRYTIRCFTAVGILLAPLMLGSAATNDPRPTSSAGTHAVTEPRCPPAQTLFKNPGKPTSVDYSSDEVVVRLRCRDTLYEGMRVSYHRSQADGTGGGTAVIGGGRYPSRTAVQVYLQWPRSIPISVDGPGTPDVIVRRYKPECREADEAGCSQVSQVIDPRPECERFAGLKCGFGSLTTIATLRSDEAGRFSWPPDLPDGQYLVSIAASLRRAEAEVESAVNVFPVALGGP